MVGLILEWVLRHCSDLGTRILCAILMGIVKSCRVWLRWELGSVGTLNRECANTDGGGACRRGWRGGGEGDKGNV